MEEYYFEFMLIGGTGLVFCFAIANKVLRFFAFAGCFVFGGLGFLPSANVVGILGYTLMSMLLAYMFSSETVKSYFADAVLNSSVKDIENK